MDGYFAFVDVVDPNRWFISGLFDPTDFDGLDFAYSDALPNEIIRIVSHRGEFWMMGMAGHEVWYDSGNADFPFRRRPGAVLRKGLTSALSITVGDGSVWWAGIDGIIYRSNGYLPKRISTHAVEHIMQENPGGANSVTNGLFYVQDGHSFYSVTFGSRTFIYDAATEAWHERSSSSDGASAWRPYCAASMPSFLALGDSGSGKLFAPVMGDTTEDGNTVIRSATLPPIYATTRRAFCARVELEMQTPLYTDDVTLEWSDDGGITWGPSRPLLPTTVASPRRRVYTTRLGSFRQRVFRVSSTASWTLYLSMQTSVLERRSGGLAASRQAGAADCRGAGQRGHRYARAGLDRLLPGRGGSAGNAGDRRDRRRRCCAREHWRIHDRDGERGGADQQRADERGVA